MTRQPSTLLALALLATAFTATAALGNIDQLVVRHADTQPLEQPFSGLSLQRQWTVARLDANASSGQHLREFQVNTFGRVFIEYATDSDGIDWEPEDAAKVIVYSNATELLDIFEAVPIEADGVALRVKNEDAYVRGLIFSKIIVREVAVLRSLELAGSADVVIGDDVLESTASAQGESFVSLTITGSGDLGIGLSSEFAVGSLDLSIHGSGDIRLNVPALHVSDALQFSVTGSGNILVASESMELTGLAVAVAGSGDIVLDVSNEDDESKCSKEAIEVSGSGDVDTASVACNTVKIDLTGSGDVKFQAVDQLSASVVGSGDLTYVNALPASVELSGPYSRRHLRSLFNHGKLSQKHHYRSDANTRYRSGNLARVVIVRVIASPNSAGHPTLHIEEYDPNDWWMSGPYGGGLVSLAVVGSMDISVLVIALGAGAVVGVAVYALLRRRHRQGYFAVA